MDNTMDRGTQLGLYRGFMVKIANILFNARV